LIAEYTISEFRLKYDIIYNVLEKHWNDVLADRSNIHGDFTHFNILIDKKNKIHLIDKKSTNHSKLFDFFYFYSYLIQSLKRSKSLPKSDFKEIEDQIKHIIKEICHYDSIEEFRRDIENMNIPDSNGLTDVRTQKDAFKNILLNN
jgi:serine/threonine-protein kinase RIO1